jgi:hypothetical protein
MESIHSTPTTVHLIWANVHRNVDASVRYLGTHLGRALSGMHLVSSLFLLFDFIFAFIITRVALFFVVNGLAYSVVHLPPVVKWVMSIMI